MNNPQDTRTGCAIQGSLGIILPLANEQETVEALLQEILSYIGPADTIHPVLDRVSTDGTRALIDGMAQADARIRLVWAPENRCVVDAYFAGYRAALMAGCGWILEMDGGFSHLPSQIPLFLEARAHDYDYVGGSRFLSGGSHQGPMSRRLLSWGGSQLARMMLKCPMTDLTGGFQLYRRGFLEEIVRDGVMSRAHFFQTEIRYRAFTKRWCEVPITYGRTRAWVAGGSILEAISNLRKLARTRPRR